MPATSRSRARACRTRDTHGSPGLWILWACALVVFSTAWLLPGEAAAQDVAKAREYYKQCEDLLSAGDPCQAARACRFGLKEANLEPLKKLEREASAACRKRSRGKDRDNDGIPDKKDRCKRDAEDMDGFQDSDGCPDDDNDEDNVPDVDDACPMDAEDVDGFEDDDGCPDGDHDKDGVDDATDQCIGKLEDPDGHEDTDGCPDEDNDADGLLDTDDECPDVAEDMDGRDDDDGCPDLDHDGDGIAEGIDRCPDDAEDLNGFRDEDGCPDGGAGPNPWGWVVLGSGVAVLGGGVALTVVGAGLHAEVSDLDGSDSFAGFSQREAADKVEQGDLFTGIGASMIGVGAAAAIAGGVILGLTWNSAADPGAAQGPSLRVDWAVDAAGNGSPHITFGGRF